MWMKDEERNTAVLPNAFRYAMCSAALRNIFGLTREEKFTSPIVTSSLFLTPAKSLKYFAAVRVSNVL